MFTAKSNFFPDFKKGKDAQKAKMTNLFFWFLKEEEKGDDDQVKMTHLLFCKPQVAYIHKQPWPWDPDYMRAVEHVRVH